MGIDLAVAGTDSDWCETLRRRAALAQVNFRTPSDAGFKAPDPGELFFVQAPLAYSDQLKS